MTILYQRLDSRITQGSTSSVVIPGRTKYYNPSGKLFQNFLSGRPRHVYDYSHGVRSRADFQQVLDAFYVVMLTPYEGLLHRDWRDYIATQVNSACSVNVAGTTLQLQRKHNFGTVSWLRNITKPCASPAPLIYRTRSSITSSLGALTVDTTTGIVTGLTGHNSGDAYSWEGQFDVPVAFTDSEWVNNLEVSTQNLYLTSNSIKLEELL